MTVSPRSLRVSTPTSSDGYASILLEPSNPPSGGSCELTMTNETLVALEDTFTVSCEGWTDNSRILTSLIYHIYVVSDDDWYPIYRGISSTVTSYLSVESGGVGEVQLFVEIIDSADASTIALNQ